MVVTLRNHSSNHSTSFEKRGEATTLTGCVEYKTQTVLVSLCHLGQPRRPCSVAQTKVRRVPEVVRPGSFLFFGLHGLRT